MSTFLTTVNGFTPIIDVLAQETSLVTAAVYGVVWRYCQMSNRVCTASLDTISGHVGVNKRTVIRHLKLLCELGYLEDLTPDLTHRPHIYRDIGKAKIHGLVEASVEVGVTQSHPSEPRGDTESPPGVTESHPRSDTESPRSDLKSPKESIKKEKETKRGKDPPILLRKLITIIERNYGPNQYAHRAQLRSIDNGAVTIAFPDDIYAFIDGRQRRWYEHALADLYDDPPDLLLVRESDV